MKTLPIQLVHTREEQDRFLKEGMGDNKLPKWATQETVSSHAAMMSEAFRAVEQKFDTREDDGLPIMMIATLDEHATARKSYRANVRAVFDIREKRNVLGKESHRGLLVKVDNRADLYRINERVSQASQAIASQDRICGVAVIENLRLFRPTVDNDIEGGTLKVRMVDYHDEHLNNLSESLICRFGEQNGVTIRRLNYTNDLRLFAIENANPDIVAGLATMDSIISVKKMPYFELSFSPEPYNTEIEVQSPQNGESYPSVGLLDSGVAAIPHLQPWIVGDDQNIAGLEETDINRRHGTSVAAIINYGDALQGTEWTGTCPSMITSCIVNTDEHTMHISEEEMIEHIKAAISANPEVKIWNLSQGSTIEVSDDDFSDFAVTLDSIQKEKHILICKSGGNIRNENPERTRITQGADSLMSLVVGSIAHEKINAHDLEEGSRSPFSRIGYAPAGITKPDLVHYGGNAVTGIYTFSETGYQTDIFKGTSHATPRVTSLAANLGYRLEHFDPLLVRALLIHSAGFPRLEGYDNDSLRQELGFGKPAVLGDILYNDSDEFTMVLSPDLNGQDYQIQDIPFPEELIDENGHFEGEITVTVVTEPVFKSGEGSEYCQSDVQILLQTYDKITYVVLGATGVPSTYRNSFRLTESENVLVKSRYSKPSFKSMDASLRTIICSEDYHPIKKYHINLSQMIPSEKEKCLRTGRHWGMSIKATYRDATRADKEAGQNVGDVKAVVILTIRDPQRRGLTYDRCMAQLSARNFTHNDITVRQNLNIVNE